MESSRPSRGRSTEPRKTRSSTPSKPSKTSKPSTPSTTPRRSSRVKKLSTAPTPKSATSTPKTTSNGKRSKSRSDIKTKPHVTFTGVGWSSGSASTSSSNEIDKNWILSTASVTRLANWKYHSGGYTPLDLQFNKFWDHAVLYLPLTMAPNLVTFTGLLVVLATTSILAYNCPTFTEVAPTWCYAIALFGHFFYQTMDAIDGKQARRTSTSSPLGQLFDHGADAFITNLVGVLNCCCMLYGSSPWSIINTLFNFQVFFLAQFEEYHTGVLNINNGVIGLTEGQVLQMLMMLTVTVLGPEAWFNNIPYFDIQWRFAALIAMAGVTFMLSLQGLFRVFYSVKQSKLQDADRGLKEFSFLNQIGQLLPQYVIYAASIYYTSADIFKTQPLIVFMACGIACSFYTTKVIVAQMSKSPIDYVWSGLTISAPLAFASLHSNNIFNNYEYTRSILSGVSDYNVMLVALGFISVQYFYFVCGVVFDLARCLDIYVFSTGKRSKTE